MKILLSWLNEYVALADDSARVVEALNSLGLVVDSVTSVGETVPGVVTARVQRVEQHPGAAKVQRVYVDTGDGTEHHVWCGAFNMRAGDVVPLATLGTVMPDGRTIARRAILGIDSEGMLCSPRELSLGDDHSGIAILPADLPLGVPYGEALGIEFDVLLDLEIERNRPDALGYAGVARDLAAHFGVPFTPPTPTLEGLGEPSGDDRSAAVTIVDGDRCGRFTSTVLSGVTVGPSAPWMARRLTAAGMRPINNVVDVSNYVMLELNQPNHAYDLATLTGSGDRPGFRVRVATEGETLTTLDGTTRTLSASDLLICDVADRPIGIAGVMGGLDTEITGDTTTVVLEVAWFEPTGVSQTVTRLALRSDASARFERGVDPYTIDTAIARFVELLRETCPDVVVHRGAVDARGSSIPPQTRSTRVRVSQVNRILGTALGAEDLPALLDPIGYTTTCVGDECTVALPSWRPDSAIEIDVIEEVARRYGYDRLGRRIPKPPAHGHLSGIQQRRRQLRQVLLGLGLSEAMPNPFLAPDTLARAGLDGDPVRITNPLVADESVLRTSLRPGLLRAIAFNESHRRFGAAFFEIGHVFEHGEGELPIEYEALGVAIAGAEAPAAVEVWNELTATLGFGARIDQTQAPAGLHPTRSAVLTAGRGQVGVLGEVAPSVLRAFDVSERVAVLELDLSVLLARSPKVPQWKPISRFPSSDLDVAFVLPDDVPADRLEKAIRQGAGNLAVDLSLFDVYRGPSVGDGRRSLAYRLRLQSDERSLTDKDIAEVQRNVVAAAERQGASLRA